MQPRGSLLVRLCSLVAVLIEYDKKGRARHTPHKRYFIMFVRSTPCSSCVCIILSVRTATKAATPNCVSQSIVRARHTPHKRYFIMFVRSRSCSSCICVIWSVRAPRRLLRLTAFLREAVSVDIMFICYTDAPFIV